MPAALERKLKKEAKDKNIKDKDAYVYGALRKTGWKPNREKKMNNPSKLVRLAQIDDQLDSIVRFAYDDEETRTKGSLAGTVAKGGALAGVGTAGLYGYGLTRRGVNPSLGGVYRAAGQDIHNVGSAMAAGRAPTAAVRDIGSSIAAGGRGVAQQVGMGLQKLKTSLPAFLSKFHLSSKVKEMRFDEHLLEPASEGQVPKTKLVEEEFPADLSPAAVLQFPYPKLMKFLQSRNILQQQYTGLSAKLDKLIQFEKDDEYQPRPFQRYFLGPGLTTAIHAPSGQKAKGFFHTTGRQLGETYGGMGIGAALGTGVGAGIGALRGGKAMAKSGAMIGALAGETAGGVAGGLHGIYGKRATELYKKYTNQSNLSSLLDGIIEFAADTKKKVSGTQLRK